jgi:hypothetical protein
MIHTLATNRDEEWHTGDGYDCLQARIDRLDRFKQYVKLHKEFGP